MKKSLIFLILCAALCGAQNELPVENETGEMNFPFGFYSAQIRFGQAQEDELKINWHHTADTDTFWVYNAGKSLEYSFNKKIRTVWYQTPMRYERRMAMHHLREFIFSTPLSFNNLEELANGKKVYFLEIPLANYFL